MLSLVFWGLALDAQAQGPRLPEGTVALSYTHPSLYQRDSSHAPRTLPYVLRFPQGELAFLLQARKCLRLRDALYRDPAFSQTYHRRTVRRTWREMARTGRAEQLYVMPEDEDPYALAPQDPAEAPPSYEVHLLGLERQHRGPADQLQRREQLGGALHVRDLNRPAWPGITVWMKPPLFLRLLEEMEQMQDYPALDGLSNTAIYQAGGFSFVPVDANAASTLSDSAHSVLNEAAAQYFGQFKDSLYAQLPAQRKYFYALNLPQDTGPRNYEAGLIDDASYDLRANDSLYLQVVPRLLRELVSGKLAFKGNRATRNAARAKLQAYIRQDDEGPGTLADQGELISTNLGMQNLLVEGELHRVPGQAPRFRPRQVELTWREADGDLARLGFLDVATLDRKGYRLGGCKLSSFLAQEHYYAAMYVLNDDVPQTFPESYLLRRLLRTDRWEDLLTSDMYERMDQETLQRACRAAWGLPLVQQPEGRIAPDPARD